MRRVTISLVAAVLTILIVAVGADYGTAIYAEHRLSKALVGSPGMQFDPEVTISGFPVIAQVSDRHFGRIGITARGVDLGGGRRGDLRSTLTDVRPVGGSRLVGANTVFRATSVSGSTTIDSVAMGRFLGIHDLTVNTPAPKDTAGGGGPQDGLLSRTDGVLMTGSVAPGPSRASIKVSVLVDLSIRGGALHVQATDFYRGPEEHSDTRVAQDDRAAVLAGFTRTLPRVPLPWGMTATKARSSGSDIELSGVTVGATTTPTAFLTGTAFLAHSG